MSTYCSQHNCIPLHILDDALKLKGVVLKDAMDQRADTVIAI